MAGTGQEDFESLARRYWTAWGDVMRDAAAATPPSGTGAAGGGIPGMSGFAGMPGSGGFPGATPPTGAGPGPAWRDAIDWWARYARGGQPGADDVLARVDSQVRDWFARLQQVSGRFAGQDATPADVSRAWKEALGAAGENPFPEMFRVMRGDSLKSFEQWLGAAMPSLEMLGAESRAWLATPAFGPQRERQERLQRLVAEQLDYRQHSDAYNALMLRAGQEAYVIFEQRLLERAQPGRQLDSPRALFDLWIDAAEEAYARIALSQEFREVFGRLVNAQMRLRAGIQHEIELATGDLGIPTRTEVDAAHRKIAELERALRRLRDSIATLRPTARREGQRGAGATGEPARGPSGAAAASTAEAGPPSRARAAGRAGARAGTVAKAAPSARAVKAARTVESARSAGSVGAAKATKVAKATKATKATKAAKATKAVEATKSAKATKATKSAKATERAGTTKSARPRNATGTSRTATGGAGTSRLRARAVTAVETMAAGRKSTPPRSSAASGVSGRPAAASRPADAGARRGPAARLRSGAMANRFDSIAPVAPKPLAAGSTVKKNRSR